MNPLSELLDKIFKRQESLLEDSVAQLQDLNDKFIDLEQQLGDLNKTIAETNEALESILEHVRP